MPATTRQGSGEGCATLHATTDSAPPERQNQRSLREDLFSLRCVIYVAYFLLSDPYR